MRWGLWEGGLCSSCLSSFPFGVPVWTAGKAHVLAISEFFGVVCCGLHVCFLCNTSLESF